MRVAAGSGDEGEEGVADALTWVAVARLREKQHVYDQQCFLVGDKLRLSRQHMFATCKR